MQLLAGSFFKCLSFTIACMPRRIREVLGDGIGFLWFDVLRIRRQVAVDNVAIAFPDKSLVDREEIARASLKSMGRTIVEYTLFPFLKRENIDTHFDFQNTHHVEEALKQGKGVILLTLHLGNGDFAIAALSRMGWPMHLISKEFKSRWLNDLWFGMRRKHGTRFISPEKSSFEILRALRRNEMVVFVLDQFMGPPIGVRTKFFGKETGTAAGCALMADRTGAPVIPCYTYRRSDGRAAAVFEEPIPYLDDSLRAQNIAVMTQRYTDKIESIVRRYPEQWMWIHRRWKEFRD
jgi:KDO2-lipid IV(A) lauroyltransferase